VTPYELKDFLAALDEWVDQENPGQALRLAVLNWIFTRQEIPYEGVTRESGFENLWFGRVPGTEHGDGQVVVCAYWIQEREHSVRCDKFATLSTPV